MADIIDRLLALSPKELKRWRSRRRGRGGYRRRDRPERSREQLAAYLRRNGFRSRRQLRVGRGEGDPTDDDYVKEYGSWSDAVKEIWRTEQPSREFIAKAVVEFGLWSKDDYEAAHKRMPEAVPSMRVVRREFGGWGILKEIATAMSLRKTLEAYMELKSRLGRSPTKEDCRMAGLVIAAAIRVYGSKRGLDAFVRALEEMT
jgi:hypothetical protein